MSGVEIQIALLSLKVAAVATVAALPVAVLIAFALAKPGWRGRGLVNVVVHLPLVLPPVVTGYALLVLFGPTAPLGQALASFGIVFAFNWTGAALAAAVMAFPLMVRAIRLSMEAVDPGLLDAARTLGAPRVWAFALVTLPLALPGIIAGAVLGFAKALGEFGATITFVSSIPGETRTLPLAIYTALQAPGGEAAAGRLVLVSLLISFAALIGAEWLGRRGGRS